MGQGHKVYLASDTRDRCITAMLATLMPVRKDRDTKAELNRRGQACEVLIGTGISRRLKKKPLING